MANILISDLNPAGLGLLTDSESFIPSMTDLSVHEMAMTCGGRRTRTRTRTRHRTHRRTHRRTRTRGRS